MRCGWWRREGEIVDRRVVLDAPIVENAPASLDWLGVVIDGNDGIVLAIAPHSPARRVVRVKDQIEAINGDRLGQYDWVTLSKARFGTVTITVERDFATLEFTVIIPDVPAQ